MILTLGSRLLSRIGLKPFGLRLVRSPLSDSMVGYEGVGQFYRVHYFELALFAGPFFVPSEAVACDWF